LFLWHRTVVVSVVGVSVLMGQQSTPCLLILLVAKAQAVAMIADRTATQQTHVRSYAKNYRGHVT